VKQWIEKQGNPTLEGEFARSLGVSSLVARLLVNRNITSVEEAQSFLYGSLEGLHDPYLMKDMDRAVERIQRAVNRGERSVIYGDYDVDGITGAVLLYKCLCLLGVKPEHFVPDRISDGYGINENAVVSLKDYDLMISVDCGISDYHPLQRAAELGIEVIVTDHHKVPPLPPPAWAIINPQREDCSYPFSSLSGVGVAYKLAVALLRAFGKDEKIACNWLDLVALGTVADVVPLVGENRVLVREGLARLKKTRNPGIRTLKVVSSLEEKKIGVYEVGYLLAPRLNAASRMGQARLAFVLLSSDDELRCAAIARELDFLNNERKNIEQKIFNDAKLLSNKQDKAQKAVVLASDKWHVGVTGIVASKLKEEVHRPVLLVSWDGHNKGKGTARSIPGFPITSALSRCKDLLTGYGGHDAAAGFSMERKNWEGFRNCFLRLAEEEIRQEDLTETIYFDQEIDLSSQTYDIIAEIGLLSPFGVQNPEPVFSARNIKSVGTPREVGNNHLKLVLQQGRYCYDAIGFKMAGFLPSLKSSISKGEVRVDVAFSLRKNFWRGKENTQLYLKDLIVH